MFLRLRTQRCLTARISSSAKGFTLVEILIVAALIGVLSSIIVARYRDFDSVSILHNMTYEVALSVREAQITTLSAGTIGGITQNAYGIFFTSGTNQYNIFVDNNPANNMYDGSTELVKGVTMGQGSRVSKLCVRTALGGSCTDVSSVAVIFTRPHLDTTFVTSGPSVNNVVELVVTVSSARGATSTVSVLKSSRVAIQ